MEELSALVFDLDGTLIDSAPDLHTASVQLLKEEGREPLSLATIRSFVGNGVPQLVKRVIRASDLDDSPQKLTRMTKRFTEFYRASLTDLSVPYPGVETALSALQTRGHKMAVCTNKPAALSLAILQELGLAQYFQCVVGGDALEVMKPDPAPVHHALRNMGAHRALYIGDSETCAQTANNAGLPFILYTEGYRHGDIAEIDYAWAFSHFDALLQTIDRATGTLK